MEKGINKEDKLNDDDDLKNSASTLKNLKSKPEFTKSAVSI